MSIRTVSTSDTTLPSNDIRNRGPEKAFQFYPTQTIDPMTSQTVVSDASMLFWSEESLLSEEISPLDWHSNEMRSTKYKLHWFMKEHDLFNQALNPQILGVHLAFFAFSSALLTDDQRRDQFPRLIFDLTSENIDYYKLAMGSYLYSSAQLWMKISQEDAAARFQEVRENHKLDLQTIEKCYKAPSSHDIGIEFPLTTAFTLTEDLLRDLCHGLLKKEKMDALVELFRKNDALDTPIDASKYGKVLSDFFYGIGSRDRTSVEVLLLGLPLLASPSLCFETLLCQYFEKRERNTAYFENLTKTS